jgi:hypothetical protein
MAGQFDPSQSALIRRMNDSAFLRRVDQVERAVLVGIRVGATIAMVVVSLLLVVTGGLFAVRVEPQFWIPTALVALMVIPNLLMMLVAFGSAPDGMKLLGVVALVSLSWVITAAAATIAFGSDSAWFFAGAMWGFAVWVGELGYCIVLMIGWRRRAGGNG